MNSKSHIKEIVCRNLRDILQPSELTSVSSSNENNLYQTLGNKDIESDSVASRNLSKSIKVYVENSLISDVNDLYKSIVGDTSKETWKIDVSNVCKVLINGPKLSEVQESLFNILETCLKEFHDNPITYLNEFDIDCSPLLQPKNIIQVAECMSVENPLDVRLNALHCLLKSHFTDAVNGESWSLLKRILVDNLCDSNQDVFHSCLKVHAKLASSSSSEAMKECALNLMDGLLQHYFFSNNENKSISFHNIHFCHMVHLTRLLLDIFMEVTLNIARFGDNKLHEIIDNFIQLMNIHVTNKQTKKNKSFLTPLEIVSYLDPNGKWLSNFTHFFLSRQLLFSSISKNMLFMRIITEELVNWINDPVIPLRQTSKVLQGGLNSAEQRYCMFCHSLSIFSTICSFNAGKELFPIKVAKKEELLSIKDIFNMIIKLLNEFKFNDLLCTKASETFKSFIARNLAKLLKSSGIHDCSSTLVLNKDIDHFTSPIALQMCDIVSMSTNLSNLFIHSNIPLKRKFAVLLHSVIVTNNTIHALSAMTNKVDIEFRGSYRGFLDSENRELIPFDEFLKIISDKLKNCNFRDMYYLIQILTRLIKDNDRESSITSYITMQHFIYFVSEKYIKLHKGFNVQEPKVSSDDLFIVDCCAQFLLNCTASSLGFHILKEMNMVGPVLVDVLQNPIVNWSDPVWLLFIFKSTTTNEGCAVFFEERDLIIRKELTQLWNTIDEDCSGSELPVEESLNYLLRIISNLTFSLKGVKALINDSKCGSELTLTDESDIRPSNIHCLIQYFALNCDSSPDYIHHHFALTVLRIIVSNIDSSLYLENKLKYQESLLEMQAANCYEDNSEVIIDECSLLRHKIIEQSRFPNPLRVDVRPTHVAPRPESTLNHAKSRSRGTGEFARWLSETRLGLHDYNWLKHAQKLYKNSCCDDIKGSTILDLLEQVIKVFPETKPAVKWDGPSSEDVLLPEEQLAVQLVMRYGAHYRLIQSTQQNIDNLSHLIITVKHSLKKDSNSFEGFDWFVASAYLLCSGNLEKTQNFLSLISGLPNAQLLWINVAEADTLVKMGHLLENIVAEELPTVFQALQSAGLSWWQMCDLWISQCWWNIFDWPQICHWFIISILHQPDYQLYFFVALLHANQDRIVVLTQQEVSYKIIMDPIENFQLSEIRIYIEKLHKKYHIILQPYFALNR